MDANILIKTIVDKHEDIYGGDPRYNETITRIATIDLNNISETEVRNIVETFLYGWGKMGRVLGRQQFSGWQKKVSQIIKQNSGIIKQFQVKNIEKENLSAHKDEIIRLYESFKEATGQIATAKILNVICPDFFPLWDNAIADAFRVESANQQGNTFNISIRAFSGEDYFRFMEGIKSFVARHIYIISHLSSQYQQRKLRIVDECLWQTVRRPFFLIF